MLKIKVIINCIIGFEFSPNGSQIVFAIGAGAHSSVNIFNLPSLKDIDRKLETMTPFSVFHLDSLNLVSFLKCNLLQPNPFVVTAQNSYDSSNPSELHVLVSVWRQESFHDKPLKLQQSINVLFPIALSNIGNPLSYRIGMTVDCSEDRRYLLLSHRYAH